MEDGGWRRGRSFHPPSLSSILAFCEGEPPVTPLPPLADYAYTRPFLQPLPVWNYWYLLLLPLCVAVAVVYKAIKCNSMKRVPLEAAQITGWILLKFRRRRRGPGGAGEGVGEVRGCVTL